MGLLIELKHKSPKGQTGIVIVIHVERTDKIS